MSENPYANMSVAQLEARRAEILKKKQQMASKPPSNDPYANMSIEELEAKRQAILQKRQKRTSPPEPTWGDRASQFGSGFMHSLGTGALNAQNPEEEMWSPNTYENAPLPAFSQMDPYAPEADVPNSLAPETKEYLKNYIQTQQPSQNADLTERMLHGAGQWIGEGVKMPLVPGWSNALTNIDKLRAIGRTAGLTAAGGATSGTLQHAGVNPGIADLSAGFLTPLGIGAAKKIGKGAKYAVSPEVREQAAKAKGENLARFGFKKSLEGLENPPTENIGEAISVEHNLKPLSERIESEDAGKTIRESLSRKKEILEKKRTEKTKHLYENLENSNELYTPSSSTAYIAKELRNSQGSIRDTLKKFRKELGVYTNKNATKELKQYSELKKTDPKSYEIIESILDPNEQKMKRPGQLDSIRQDLGDAIESAYKSGHKKLGKKLKELKLEVEADLERTPVGLEHSNMYKKYSKPLNPLEKGSIGDILKKDVFKEDYLVKDAEIMNAFTGSGKSSQDSARKLLQEIGTDKKALDSVKKYINGQVLDYITDIEGNISPNKLKTWMAKHKGAFILDPNLEKKLSKLSNAQLFSKNMIDNYSKLPLIDALDKVPAKILKKMGRKIVGFDVLIDDFLKMKKSKELGHARKLFEKALKDPKAAEELLKPVKELSKTAKLWRTLSPYVNAVKPKKHEDRKDQ